MPLNLLRQRLERIAGRQGPVHFVVRLDAAGQYADNLSHFLHRLGTPDTSTPGTPAPFTLTLSCGDPQRNKNYRAALFGSQKSDPVEARAAARFALTEQPTSATPLSRELRTLRQVAGRLQEEVGEGALLITRGAQGMSLFTPGAPPVHIPAQARTIYEGTGAGDTVVAVLALLRASGMDLLAAAQLANYAAGIVVGKVGTACVTIDELLSGF